jgi:hypothetical protein
MLRLRLQVAMYKVQTNQVHIPMARLELRNSPAATQPNTPISTSSRHAGSNPAALSTIHPLPKSASSTAPDESMAASDTRSSSFASALGQSSESEGNDDEEEEEEEQREVAEPKTLVPKLLPGPVLQPTAFSSRFITADTIQSSQMHTIEEEKSQQDVQMSEVEDTAASGLLELMHASQS